MTRSIYLCSRAFRNTIVLLAALSLAACASTPPPPEPRLVTQVLSEPVGLTVQLKGQPLGVAPLSIGLGGLDEAALLTVEQASRQVLERRIQILGPESVRVTLSLSDLPSEMAQALGMSDVVVFDYGQRASFEVDQYEIKQELGPLLRAQARVLNEHFAGLQVHVCGHTDSSGGDDHNRVLSLRRAQAVVDFLAENGVDPERLQAQGFASDYPLAPNGTKEGKALNRRTEIVLGQ